MANVVMYKTPTCPYCTRTKQLLASKGVTKVTEIDITTEPHLMQEMMQKAGGRRTVPQIFIDDQHIGGFDDLAALDGQGKLEPLL